MQVHSIKCLDKELLKKETREESVQGIYGFIDKPVLVFQATAKVTEATHSQQLA